MKVCNGCQELPLLLFSAEKNREKWQQSYHKTEECSQKSEFTFALNYPDGRKCQSMQNTPILSLYIKDLKVQARIDKYRAEGINGCVEQKNHHHTEIYLLFKDLSFFFLQKFQVSFLF